MCWAVSEKNVLLGEVCPACLKAGPEAMERRLKLRAVVAEQAAEEKRGIADEGVSDCPTLDELWAAEAFYGKAMFETAREHEEAPTRGEEVRSRGERSGGGALLPASFLVPGQGVYAFSAPLHGAGPRCFPLAWSGRYA
jgi:hypothetical protein